MKNVALLFSLILIVSVSFGQWMIEDVEFSVPADTATFDPIYLSFGASPEATDNYDVSIDEHLPPCPPTGICIFINNESDDPLTSMLKTDVRSSEHDTIVFNISINGNTSNAFVSWEEVELPDYDGIDFSITPYDPTSEPDWSSSTDMRSATSLEVAVGDYVAIRYLSSDAIKTDNVTPDRFSMFSATPNPFNSETIIKWDSTEKVATAIEIFDISGEKIHSTELNSSSNGNYQWRANDMSSGVYIVRMKWNDSSSSEMKIFLVK
jgi:hypothetical protein